ncbi:hypothetical protein BGX24_000534 [Mortierella sp. AD032]|nr:hypothetical protein BGX24_000534 [Mortierella sp. AD032]
MATRRSGSAPSLLRLRSRPELSSLTANPCKFNRSMNAWECPLAPEVEVEAGTVEPNRELPCRFNRSTNEWECPLSPEVESQAESVEPEAAPIASNGRECRKVGQKWICPGEK